MELQNKESTSLPLYEKQLRETETGIQNMLNAIQAGILTSSTKERLEALEAQKRDLEAKIAEEKLAKPVMKKVRKPFLSARPPRLRQRKKVRIWIALVHHKSVGSKDSTLFFLCLSGHCLYLGNLPRKQTISILSEW